MSQLDLAAACGWESQSRISMYERDERVPNPQDTDRIAKALGVTGAEIMFGAPPSPHQIEKQLQVYDDKPQTRHYYRLGQPGHDPLPRSAFAIRLTTAAHEAKLPLAKIANELDMPLSVMHTLTTSAESSSWAPALAAVLGVNFRWLQSAEQPKHERIADEPATYNVTDGPEIRTEVPLISWAQAGDWQDTHDPYTPGDADEWIPNATRGGPNTYALRVQGESMAPEFSEGEILFVDPDRSPHHRDYVIVRLTESDRTTFKQYIEDETGQGFLRAVNTNWDPVTIPAGERAVIKGVVIFSGRFR